ncbi:MAG: hypothetical protein AD742_14545 [Methylibium sp. NZG]|nr:MAG: hypothetical protein AD742_14545 [Methylibium sp. NZG]
MTHLSTRRAFLRRNGALAAALGGAAAPWALNLAALSAASAQTAGDDYRALVCIFLAGANDNHNTVVPLDAATHAEYLRIRSSIALPLAGLDATEVLPTNPWPDGRRMALNPGLAPLKPLFDNGRVALAMNVGPMVGPVTLAQYNAGVGRPRSLFSHNDQQSTWRAGSVDSPTGWGGRMADLVLSGNGAGGIFTAVTTGGGLFLTGNSAAAYQVGAAGSTQVARVFGSDAATADLKALMQQASPHVLQETHAAVARSSIAADLSLRGALAANPAPVVFPATSLGQQLQVVARMIASRSTLGVKRQVFYVSLGGWDMHDNLIANHTGLLAQVADAMKAFYDATVAMGVAAKVTTFTASDFGRTLANNGDGSDHGWGSYHFVMGDAVEGRRWVGQLPAMAMNGPHDVGGGRLLPNISVDQYAATLATWFGVAPGNLSTVIPRIGQYASANLGFMKAPV